MHFDKKGFILGSNSGNGQGGGGKGNGGSGSGDSGASRFSPFGRETATGGKSKNSNILIWQSCIQPCIGKAIQSSPGAVGTVSLHDLLFPASLMTKQDH